MTAAPYPSLPVGLPDLAQRPWTIVSSGLPPPVRPRTEHDTLRAILATLQVIAAVLTMLTLMLAGWLLGVFPDWVSPLVEVKLG